MEYIFILIASLTFVICQSYDINNLYNESDVSAMEILRHLIKENDGEEYVSNEETFLNGNTKRNTKHYNWNSFHRLYETSKWMISLILKYPDVVSAETGGLTSEKRSIFGLKISHKKSGKGIFIEAGMHGNEWMGTAAATYLINLLVNPPNGAFRVFAEAYDWYIFPHVNPDGYVFSRLNKYNRSWRKNRSYTDGSQCEGVDLNRNWNSHWGEMVTENSSSPCDETFPGTHPFSEIESRSFSTYLSTFEKQIHLYISLHSFGNQILFPYGYTSEPPPNIADYNLIVEAAKEGFSSRHKAEYGGGSIYNSLYPLSGSSVDWVYSTGLSKLAFQIQLRTPIQYTNGFHIDENKIFEICEETVDGLESIINKAETLGYFDSEKI